MPLRGGKRPVYKKSEVANAQDCRYLDWSTETTSGLRDCELSRRIDRRKVGATKQTCEVGCERESGDTANDSDARLIDYPFRSFVGVDDHRTALGNGE